jgi:hypothetical protein
MDSQGEAGNEKHAKLKYQQRREILKREEREIQELKKTQMK